MNTCIAFVVTMLISIIISGLVIATLSVALQKLLQELCGNSVRANFWVAYTNLMLVIAPLLVVVLFGSVDGTRAMDFYAIKTVFGCALSGIFISLLAIAQQVLRVIPHATQSTTVGK